MGAKPCVSVIIPAYNAERTIADAVRAVLSQDYAGQVELIVVNDGSIDGTEAVVRSFPEVCCVRQENAGPASARNRGAREACGEVLFFTDADCSPERAWISKMMHGFLQPDIVVVAGSYGIANAQSTLARVIHDEIIFRHQVLMPRYPKAFGSYNFAIKKNVFEAVGGFDAGYRHASGEDNDLSYKIFARAGRILFLKDAVVAHYHQESLLKYLKEQSRHGFWRVKMYVEHPRMLAGDGYTFWKDALEVPWALAHAAVFFLSWYGLCFMAVFLLFEISAGIVMSHRCRDGIAAGIVMWLRSFARAFGFCAGCVIFLKDSFRMGKKNKKTLRRVCAMLI